MDVKGANPFLFLEEEHPSPSSASNPFLISNEDYQAETNEIDNQSFMSNNTNPFAFNPMDLEGADDVTNIDSGDCFGQHFIAQATICVNPIDQDIYTIDDVPTNHNVMTNSDFMPQKPTDLNLTYTHTMSATDDFNEISSETVLSRPPPSKETQDLLMSVMGAMDATSSHLLDKIPPTRTPSPVSMRDLHSPSPTPEPFGDLLDVSDTVSNQIDHSKDNVTAAQILVSNNDIFPLPERTVQPFCDINQNPSSNKAPTVPSRPAPPARPPKPQPPQKPPPPSFIQHSVTPQPIEICEDLKDNDIDLFGVEGVVPQKLPATNADIMNLYNTPNKNEKTVTDLLFDQVDESDNSKSMTENWMQPTSFTDNQFPTVVESPSMAPQEIAMVQDNFLSPVASQNDLQMDTSDSQSKGSVSSVTFNPFTITEEVNQTSPLKDDVILQDSNILDNNVFQDNTFNDDLNKDNTNELLFEPHTEQMTMQVIFNLGDDVEVRKEDDFDAFAQKFDSVKDDNTRGGIDAFGSGAWGGMNTCGFDNTVGGFEGDDTFDAFLALQEPPIVPQSTPCHISKNGSQESDEDKDFSVVIRPKTDEDFTSAAMPIIAPPPPVSAHTAFTDTSPRFNPFDQSQVNFTTTVPELPTLQFGDPQLQRTSSQETPPTPLFDDDVSQPLEYFPRTDFNEEGWEMQLRQPNKKKITGQRFWKKIFVKLLNQGDCILLQLFNLKGDKDPFQELPLQPCYSVSEIGAQQYDQFGKIFTIKLQYIFYKERPGVRPGQVKKAERITNKLSQFAAYAIQGDYQGVKEFGSDLKKLGLPVEHAPQLSQLMKLGSLNYEDLKQFSFSLDEALFKLQAHRDRALHYKMEEVQITAVDELYVEQDADGHVEKQIARVRLFFLGFLTGMPDIELGVNDMRRQGKEVVGRHDIIPVVTEEWIRLEEVEFHSCIQQEEYQDTHIIKFKPPDACYIELMRFRVRPPKNRELPLQLKAAICVTGNKVELRADVLVPGFASRKLGQIPCEDVMIRFPIPECWIYLFRVEKHFRYGSVKSAHRRTGKIKGIERILGTMETLQESLIEVTSGQAKYEHQHRAIVWRCPRLPKEGQGAYTTHNMLCKLALTSYDQMPEKLAEYCYVEFTMPATQVSHMTCRSVSMQNSDSDDPPEKYVRYLARHEYRVGIEHTEGDNPNPYAVATHTKPVHNPTIKEEKPPPVPEAESSSDSD